jgi:hypothetical protein
MPRLAAHLENCLFDLGRELINQENAKVIVEPQHRSTGFWFGGGNMIQLPGGELLVVGRYRNHGDSRTGVGAGERGLELAIFRSTDEGTTWEKALSFDKPSLNVGDREVLSIEGSAIRSTDQGFELFVSTEKKNIDYPCGLESYLKPGTGVWTIEHAVANDLKSLASAKLTTVIECDDPRFVHVKDPFLYERGDDLNVLFCSHPFCWTSSNTGLATKSSGSVLQSPVYDVFARGFTWDVAMTRTTAVVNVPKVGRFADIDASLVFYDGGECVRDLDEHSAAVKRARGYSCEELGGLAYTLNGDLNSIVRLSITEPAFVSPWGTGCSRYVDVLTTDRGMYATWQQSQADRSQPLVMNRVDHSYIEQILG